MLGSRCFRRAYFESSDLQMNLSYNKLPLSLVHIWRCACGRGLLVARFALFCGLSRRTAWFMCLGPLRQLAGNELLENTGQGTFAQSDEAIGKNERRMVLSWVISG